MISFSYIENSLKELDKLYNNASSQKKAIYYSKLALIELCGWVEETLDDIIIRHSIRHLKDLNNRRYCIEKIVDPNYGFDYKKNVRPMFISLIGLVEVEKLEFELEKAGKITQLKSTLGSIKVNRNTAAHTHLKGVTPAYQAPSRVLGDYNIIKPILIRIDRELREM